MSRQGTPSRFSEDGGSRQDGWRPLAYDGEPSTSRAGDETRESSEVRREIERMRRELEQQRRITQDALRLNTEAGSSTSHAAQQASAEVRKELEDLRRMLQEQERDNQRLLRSGSNERPDGWRPLAYDGEPSTSRAGDETRESSEVRREIERMRRELEQQRRITQDALRLNTEAGSSTSHAAQQASAEVRKELEDLRRMLQEQERDNQRLLRSGSNERPVRWSRLLRAMAYVRRFVHNAKRPPGRAAGPLTPNELKEAETLILRELQRETYPEAYIQANATDTEITARKGSPLHKRKPYMDLDGLIRMKGRIDECSFADPEMKRPVILPKNGTVVELIVDDYHRKFRHSNHETVVNELRLKYDIPALRRAVRNARNKCKYCALRSKMMINMRPLTHVPLDRDDEAPLTPNHFLLGSSSGVKPLILPGEAPPDLKNTWKAAQQANNRIWERWIKTGILKNTWKAAQQANNRIWERWIKTYLTTIRKPSKWFDPVRPMKVGELVLIVDENNPRNCWPRGIVVDVTTSRDGIVRRATVRTAKGTRLERPVSKLVALAVAPQDVQQPQQPDD
uniref:DUF5641 domain-containing protein n=1 Tax=Anopheles albimanus TaxID=7167 RepID=A0A182FMQ6_ANOAL